jgi:hypothetical protein
MEEKFNIIFENKMTKETLRMQMLSGIITESEYAAAINQEIEETEKDSLNEHAIGGIVGIGAINQIPSRAKADYEDAFEHFLGQKYELKEEMEEEIKEEAKPSKEELEKAIQQLMAIGWDRRDAENLVYGHMEEGKEVEEPTNY